MSVDLAKLVARLELQSSQFQSELEKTNKKLLGFERQSTRSLRNIEKQARDFGKNISGAARSVNAAFALLAGMGLKKAFQSIFTETANSSKEFADALDDVKRSAKDLLSAKEGAPAATAAMQGLAETLKDPALQQAADTLTSTLIKGFGAIVEGSAHMVVGLQVLMNATGDQVEELRQKIIDLEGRIQRAKARGLPTGDLEAQRLALSKQQFDAALGGKKPREFTFGFDTQLPGGDLPGFEVGDLSVMDDIRKDMAEFQRMDEIIPVDDMQEQLGKFIDSFKNSIDSGVIDTAQQAADSISEIGDKLGEDILGKTEDLSVFAEEAFRGMQRGLADFLFDPFQDGLDGMLRGFVDVLRHMVAEAAAAQIFNKLFGDTKKDGSNGLIDAISWLFGSGSKSSSFSGPRAMGGPVSAGRSYLVGERGPEMFTANVSGSIVPNHKLGAAPINVAPVYNYTGNLSREEMAIAFERNNRQLVQLIQRAQSQSGQAVMSF